MWKPVNLFLLINNHVHICLNKHRITVVRYFKSNSVRSWAFNKFASDPKYVFFQKASQQSQSESSEVDNFLHKLNTSNYLKKLNTSETLVLDSAVENELKSLIRNAELVDMLKILSAFSVDGGLYHSVTFSNGLARFEFLLRNSDIDNPFHLIQCLYFVSLMKKSKTTEILLRKIYKKLLPHISLLDLNEIGIICNSFFRLSFKLDEDLCCLLINKLKSNIDWFLNNSIPFISVIKVLRHREIYDESLFDLFSKNSVKVMELEFTPKVHLLVYLSDALYSDLKFMSNLANSSFDDFNALIKTSKMLVRIKDVDNLMWGISNYSADDINVSIENTRIDEYLVNTPFSSSNGAFIFGILLSLFKLGYKRESVYSFLTKKNILTLKNLNNFKEFAKVSLLLTCMSIEMPHLVTSDILRCRDNRIEPKMSKSTSKHPELTRLHKTLLSSRKSLNLSEVRFHYAIPSLYIPGLLITRNENNFNIEVLEQGVCLMNSKLPHGLMKLKLRLLQNNKMPTFIVTESVTDDSIFSIVENLNGWMMKNV